MRYGDEIEVNDFYEPDTSMTVRAGEEVGGLPVIRFTVEADPGAPGQGIDVSPSRARMIARFLNQKAEQAEDAIDQTVRSEEVTG